jgi:hypothetical protein
MEAEWAAVWVAVGAGLISLGSVTVAIVAVAYSRGQRDATVRQANAAEAQTAYMARQVELMEQELASAKSSGTVPSSLLEWIPEKVPTRVPPWSIAHFRGDTFSLSNGGTEPVYDVSLEPPAHTIHRGPYQWDRIDPRATTTFLLAFSMASSSRDVTVRWRWEPDGELQTWTSAVGPRSAG